MKLRLRELKENLIYTALWLVLFITPVVSMYVRTQLNEDTTFQWTEIFSVWKIYAVYFAVFIVHNFLIAPLLIYRHRKALYFATLAALLFIFTYYQCSQRPAMGKMFGGPPPHEMRGEHPGPPPDFEGTDEEWEQIFRPHARNDRETPPPMPDIEEAEHHDVPPLIFGQQDIIAVIILVLMLGMNLGVKLYFKNANDAKVLAQLERESLRQQLEYLKYQINPHFFMNTLNNIHALVDIDSERAKESIVELSKMMRYVLYEGNKSLIPVRREVEFLGNYITLMRLRFTDRVNISTDVPDEIPDRHLPPLILVTFVENAFKHGISYRHDSYINIKIRFIGDRLYFGCRNSKHPVEANNTQKPGGVGLANIRQRLDLLYADDYTLEINDHETEYEVKLEVPLKPLPHPLPREGSNS